MSWFIDASVIVAMIGNEDGWESIADRLDEEKERLWSPISRWESVIALSKRLEKSIDETSDIVNDFAMFYRFEMIPIGTDESELAIEAFVKYGKGDGHPARLNMGDCFAYACAKANGARLLYKGNDFKHTDLA